MAVLESLAEAFNAREFDRVREFMTEDAEFVDVAAGATTHGPDEFAQYARGWAGAFPDMTIETVDLVADEHYAAGEFIGHGTHDGTLPTPAGDIPATGREFTERFTWFATLAGDGKITGLRDYYNTMSMMTQLGLMPEPAAPTS